MVMLPAKTQCPSSWTLEYNGYLMTNHRYHNRGMFECMDGNPEAVPGSGANVAAILFIILKQAAMVFLVHRMTRERFGLCCLY